MVSNKMQIPECLHNKTNNKLIYNFRGNHYQNCALIQASSTTWVMLIRIKSPLLRESVGCISSKAEG